MRNNWPPLVISSIGAITPAGSTWPKSWEGLFAASPWVASPDEIHMPLPVAAAASVVHDWARDVDKDGRGPAARLIIKAIAEVAPSTSPYRVLAATNHAEADSQIGAALFDTQPATRLQRSALSVDHSVWLASACSGGLHLLWLAFLEARRSDGPWLITAGDTLSAIGVAGFFAAGATGSSLPQPFRPGSGGMLVAEGAVAIELRKDASGLFPSILGIGTSCDAFHPTHPDPSGKWLEKAIHTALNDAECRPDSIDVVVAHGTGTMLNDTVEANVIERVFGPSRPLVTSLKGTVGHMMSAAGLLNIAAAAEIWRTGRVPPTQGEGEPYNQLNLALSGAGVAPRGRILVLASGFGGNNVAAVIG